MQFPTIRLRTLMGLVALAALSMGVLECGPRTYGIGSTTLRITFVVLDAESGRPIDGATIEFWEDHDPTQARTTDSAGKYTREWITKAVSFRNWRKSTYHAYLPDIWFQTSAPGYQPKDWKGLDSAEFHEALHSAYPLSTLNVKIRLSKSPSIPTKSAARLHP